MNIETLKEEVPITEVLAHYGWVDDLAHAGWGEWRKILCPFHWDHNPSASLNEDRGLFRCFVCGDDRAMDILDIAMKEELFDNVKDAKAWLERTFL